MSRRLLGGGERRIRYIRGWIPVRPIELLPRKVRTRLCHYERRYIECLLIGEGSRLVERHIVAYERRRRAHPGHPRADVERFRSPERRYSRHSLPVRSMAAGANRPEDPVAGRAVGGERREPQQPRVRSRGGDADRRAPRQECEIGDDVAHLGTRGVKGFAVQTAGEAVVDPVLDQLDGAAPGAILRKAREAPDPAAVGAPPLVEVAADAAQPTAIVLRQALPRGREQRQPAPHARSKRVFRDFGIGGCGDYGLCRRWRSLGCAGYRHQRHRSRATDHRPPATHSRIPARVAERKFASVPASMARKPRRARSCLRSGASAPIPPIWIPTELTLANPHSANVAIVKDTGLSVAFIGPS